ncbi:GroES-like protein [Trametes versicolor FP-101664 SS1]|uniref:GroES-like protein n=1 Tax=Trametes versicolor (strain FP-101664) TaxID=717944 RepID=UPI00046245B3|nr:GroES-like protein [Trametes versicolor FP-101664 SS1]EIW57188.1 GroES-like protein [Trametes versicolor FP-101664 SS1]
MSTTTATQKALVLPAPGKKYIVGETAIPRPGPNDILVKLHAVGLNPVDWKVALPEFASLGLVPEYPFTPGSDGAGVVVEVGTNVSNFKKGDRVLFQGARPMKAGYGTFQENSLVQATLAAKIPENIGFESAATVTSALVTSFLALYNQQSEQESLRLKPFWKDGGSTAYAGKPIFILGGATSLGQSAIQLAKLSGFSPIITTASSRNTSLLTSLGATHVVDRTLPADAILAELPKLTGGKPLEVVFDGVSEPSTQVLAYRAVPPGGNLVLVLPDVIPAELKKDGEQKHIVMVRGSISFPHTQAAGLELFEHLTEWLEKGLIKPNAVEIVPNGLAGIPAGLERLKNNEVSAKKLVARPQETP